MRLFLTFAILVIISSIQFGEGGIYRRYVRRSRPRPPILHDRLGIGRRADFQQPFGYYGGRPSWSTFSFLRRPTRSSWNFMPSRVPRRLRYHHHNQRSDNNNQRVPHFHHQQQPSHYSSAGPQHLHQGGPPRTPYMRWGPFSNGNPIVRDPTFDYAPPSVDHVRLIPESRNRRTQMGGSPPVANYAFNPYHHHQRPPPPPPAAYRPSASLWKMLAHKQRPKRPFPPPHHHPHNNHIHHHSQPGMRYHGQSPSSPLYHHQAEIVPKLTNMVMFKPTDVVSSTPGGGFIRRPGSPGKSSTNSQGIGSVSAVPLYSHEQTSSSELRPVAVVKPTVGGSKEYIFTVVGYKGPSAPATSPLPPAPLPSTTPAALTSTSSSSTPAPSTTTSTAASTTRRSPTLLHAVKTTPVTISSTHNSAVKPFEPTESLGNNHRHPSHKKEDEIDDEDEESAEESKVQEQVSKPTNKKKQNQGTSGHPLFDGILSYLDMTPPEPIFPIQSNSFNILSHNNNEDEDDSKSEEESEEEIVNKRPVFNNPNNKPSESSSVSFQTSTSISVSVSKDKVTTTPKTPLSTKRPLTSPTKSPVRTTSTTAKPTTTSTTTTEASTTTTAEPSTSSKAPKFANLPVMPKYTRNKTPVYAKKNHHSHKNMNKPLGKYSSASSSSALSKEINGSGEIVVITGGRSKVKEYKPQFISENSGLLAFDKVASDSSSTSSSVVTSTSASPSSTSTTPSPLQQFDPMQLLHSWLTKSSD